MTAAAALVDWHAVAPTLAVLLLAVVLCGAACAVGADARVDAWTDRKDPNR